jgi:hypothetical protein
MNEHNYQLNKRFANTLARIERTTNYDTDSYTFELHINVNVDAKQWNQYKRRKVDPIDKMHLVVDLSNFLYRSYGVQARCPMVSGLKNRAHKGLKTIAFTYLISSNCVYNLGFKEPAKQSYYSPFRLKPIVTGDNTLLVVGEK